MKLLFLKKLKSRDAINRLERTWLEVPVVDYLIKTEASITGKADIVTDGKIDIAKFVKLQTVKDIFNFIIENEVNANGKFWMDLIPTLTQEPIFSDDASVSSDTEFYGSRANIGSIRTKC